MKKIDFGQSLALLANFGVLIGILLLVVELNQNRALMRAETRTEIANALVSLTFETAVNPELVETILKYEADEPLTAIQARQFQGYATAMWQYRQNTYQQYLAGLYDESEYLPLTTVWKIWLDRETYRAHWCGSRPFLSESFVNEIARLLEEIGQTCD